MLKVKGQTLADFEILLKSDRNYRLSTTNFYLGSSSQLLIHQMSTAVRFLELIQFHRPITSHQIRPYSATVQPLYKRLSRMCQASTWVSDQPTNYF